MAEKVSIATDHELAAALAEEAGRLLLELRARISDPAELKAAGDRRANELILAGLAEARPDDPILSEESPDDDDARHGADRVWIVDPLDGTREFGEAGRTDWAVHVALAERGRPTVGAVALPARGLVLSTDPAPVVPARPDGPIRLLVSRSRPPELAEHLAATLDAELVPMGSAGAKTMAVVLGDGDVYAHSGGQYQWDSAAPVAVARAAGLHATRLDGSPLVYGESDPWLPDLLVCRPELAPRVQTALRLAPSP
ncbi:MAG: 3'(2'),5'-bisphosphate nucleotidase CysQ [Acidimicrobiia bacterium]